jgi:hypothetical protein
MALDGESNEREPDGTQGYTDRGTPLERHLQNVANHVKTVR